jgi:hypothetical protein
MINIRNLPRRVYLLQTEDFDMATQFRVFSANELNRARKHHGRLAMMPSFIVLHPL